MPRLDESRRKWLCRRAFVLLCLVPTLAVAAMSVSRETAAHREAFERAAAEHTGLTARIGRVTHPAPRMVLFEGLELVDPLSRAVVARARAVEWAVIEGVARVHLSQAEFEAAHAPRLWGWIERRLRGEPPLGALAMRVSADSLTWKHADASQTFIQLDCRLDAIDAGREFDAAFRLADTPAAEPAEVRVVRGAMGDGGTQYSFSTGGAALPVSIFAPLVDARPLLGPRAMFLGSLAIDARDGGWDGDLFGRLIEVDLGRLVADRFPHKLAGAATVEVALARFEGGKLVEAEGRLAAGPGVVGRSLIESARTHLGLLGSDLPADRDVLPYTELAAGFFARGGELKLVGRATSGAPGGILVDGRASYLVEPERAATTLVNLLRALSPANEHQVPATAASEALMRALPLAPIAQPATNEPPRAHPRVGEVLPSASDPP